MRNMPCKIIEQRFIRKVQEIVKTDFGTAEKYSCLQKKNLVPVKIHCYQDMFFSSLTNFHEKNLVNDIQNLASKT